MSSTVISKKSKSVKVYETMQQLQTPTNYQFSGANLDQLGAAEYTLATVVVDVSGSVSSFKVDLEKSIKTTVASCQDSPRCDNLLMRVLSFNDSLKEVHGFRPLADIDVNGYDNSLNPCGGTALFDAVMNGVEASEVYGKQLVAQDIMANAVIYVITDGCSNSGYATAKSVKKAIEKIAKDEKSLESVAVILIMVGYGDANAKTELDNFRAEANITQFVDLTDLFAKANPAKALAKLAGYISKSVSSTSKALASGSSAAASSKLVI